MAPEYAPEFVGGQIAGEQQAVVGRVLQHFGEEFPRRFVIAEDRFEFRPTGELVVEFPFGVEQETRHAGLHVLGFGLRHHEVDAQADFGAAFVG